MAYAEGVDDDRRQLRALEIIQSVPRESTVVPAQALAELFNVLVRKGRSRELARMSLMKWRDGFPVIDTTDSVVLSAAQLANDHQLGIWDSIILASSYQAGCRLILSEDLQDGFTWSGITVVNPFSAAPHPLLQLLFTAGST